VASTITERAGGLFARYEADDVVFEVTFEELGVTDVELHFRRDGERVGGVYNDDGTRRTMAQLSVPGEDDFVGARVPKSFVADVLDAAEDAGRLADDADAEGYRLRVLDGED